VNNAQLAAARKVMSQFPALRIRKDGWKLTPANKAGAMGATVEVTETMSTSTLTDTLTASCETLQNG
jgi:hypothetical protein